MDHSTFADPDVVALSRNFVMLKADLTTSRDPLTKKLRREYDVRGVPTYVFLTPDGNELAELRLVGFYEKDMFIGHMQAALATSQ
jgi:thiol:disulfide interchange protein DsbD